MGRVVISLRATGKAGGKPGGREGVVGEEEEEGGVGGGGFEWIGEPDAGGGAM